jgi:hypothetical protein
VRLLTYASALGYEYTFGEAERTKEMQEIYIKTGKSHTYNSNHLRRCAVDLFFFKDGELTYNVPELGKFWEEIDPKNSWGGNWKSFKDAPHFERRP